MVKVVKVVRGGCHVVNDKRSDTRAQRQILSIFDKGDIKLFLGRANTLIIIDHMLHCKAVSPK